MSRHHSIEEIGEALRKTGGFVSKTAEILELTPQAIYKRIREDDELRAILDNIEGAYLDLAESKLIKAIGNEHKWAIEFYLKTKGKKRGYVERQEHTGADGEPVVFNINMIPASTLRGDNDGNTDT